MKGNVFACMALFFLVACMTVSAQAPGWARILPGISDNFKGVFFITPDRGYVVGDNGVLHITTDGGSTWTTKTLPTTSGLWGVHAVAGTSGDIIFLAGDNGTMLKSADGGSTWAQQDVKYDEGFTFGVVCADKDNCWVTGGEGEPGSTVGVIVRTRNGGQTWTKTTISGTYSFDKSSFVDAMTGYAAATLDAEFAGGAIYKTTDGGATWQKKAESDAGAFNSIHAFDADNAIAVGFSGVVMRTTDGGATWQRPNIPPQYVNNIYTHVTFIDDRQGYIVGPAVILASSDGGATWQGDPAVGPWTDPPAIFWSMSVARPQEGAEGKPAFYAVGDEGIMYKYLYEPPPGPAVLLDPSQIAFGDVALGSSDVKTVKVDGTRLQGNVTLTAPAGFLLMIDESEAGESELVLSPETNGTLEWTIYIRFKPTAAGEVNGMLKVVSENLDLDVPISGRGTATTGVDAARNAAFISVLPNPVSGRGTVALGLAERAHVTMRLYDPLGREVVSMMDDNLDAGRHDIVLRTAGLAKGIYRLRLDLNGAPARELPVVITQ